MILLLTILVISLILHLILKYPNRAYNTRDRTDLDGPKGLPIIGNYLGLLLRDCDVLLWVYELKQRYGQIFALTLPKLGRVICINSPELLEHILKTNFDHYEKGEIFHDVTKDFLGDGILNSDGYKWKYQRKIISKLFQGKNFRDLICVEIERETQKVLRLLEQHANDNDAFDLQDLFNRFTLETFGKIAINVDFQCLTYPENPIQFAKDFDFVETMLDFRFLNPIWHLTEMFTSDGRGLKESLARIHDFTMNIIKKRRENAKEKNEDLLDLFMNAEVEEEKRKLTDEELSGIMLNLIIAGRDTTAQALSWMMYNVMMNPSVEQNLLNELSKLLTQEKPIPDFDSVKDFKYTQATFYETLRLYPSVSKNMKVCVKDDVLPNGVKVYKGEFVAWHPYIMGRDETLWGDDAKQFNPDRFSNSEDGLKPSQFKFSAFNMGPRLCLGKQFATVEAVTLASVILHNFKFELLPGQKHPPDYSTSLTFPMKNPLMVKVYKR